MYEEITAVYSRKNKELFLTIFDQEGNEIISSKMPKLVAYKMHDIIDGPNRQKYQVVHVEDHIFNPKKLHIAKLKRIEEDLL